MLAAVLKLDRCSSVSGCGCEMLSDESLCNAALHSSLGKDTIGPKYISHKSESVYNCKLKSNRKKSKSKSNNL